jgi:hypothetical protein
VVGGVLAHSDKNEQVPRQFPLVEGIWEFNNKSEPEPRQLPVVY